MVKPKLTFCEWEQCLNEISSVGEYHLSSKDSNWKTRLEIQSILGKGSAMTKYYLKCLVDAGAAIASSEVRRNMSGKRYAVPVYKINPKAFKEYVAKKEKSK